MPAIKLTERAIAKLKAPTASGKQVLVWDAELKGFGVLLSGVSNARTYVVQRTLPSGKSRRVTIAAVSELPLKAAREEAARVLLALRRGKDPKEARQKSMTLREALDAYLASNSSLRPRSRAGYEDVVTRWFAPWLDLPLRDITADMVEQRHRQIAEGVAASGRGTGHATANGAMRALRALWNYVGEREPDLPQNPVKRLRRSWFPSPRREGHVRADELPKFYEAVQALPNAIHRDYLLLLLFTGLRRREAAALEWSDVDFGAGVIRIPAARTKAGRTLDLPMTDFVRDLLVARGALGRERFIFPGNSRSRHLEEPKFALRQVAAACGIKVSVHDLRRTFVTVAESADISPMALKALVNHSLGGGLTEGYIQMSAERLREPAQRVADRMKALCGIAPVEGVVAMR